MRRSNLALGVLVVLSLLVTTVAIASANTTTLDEDTALTEETVIEDYETEGVATASETVPEVTITIADSSEDVDVHGLRYTDWDSTYLRVEYEESIERTIRFYVPREYWHPHPDRLDAVDSDMTATMEPTASGNYTAVTVHFEEEADPVFEVKQQASIVFSARDHGTEWLSNETGVDVPSASGEQEQWEYVPTAELTEDDPAFGIDTEGDDVTLQYDAANTSNPTEKRWRTVPDCSRSAGSDAPVCTFTQDTQPDRIYVLAQTDSPPDIRYHHDAGFFADLRSSGGELGDIVDAAISDANDFIEGIFA